jgi:NAD(P)-dependent dehydrogenase (short-subunit alcohol dehydrogenase family)
MSLAGKKASIDSHLTWGIPEDIGRAVAFLSSPAAGNITGVSLPVDGGLLATGV